jgi:hypothetical protein
MRLGIGLSLIRPMPPLPTLTMFASHKVVTSVMFHRCEALFEAVVTISCTLP